jgi:hypothetical protein
MTAMATTQGASDGDYVAHNEKHQTELVAISRPDGSFTVCADVFWNGEQEHGTAVDITAEQALGLLQWLQARVPQPINGATVPLSEVIVEPCKGCGKRPIDFMSGA